MNNRGDLVAAEALYREALATDAGQAEAWFGLGAVCQMAGRPAEAAAHYRQAVACRPAYAEAHNNLGVVLEETGFPEEATTRYRQALQLRSDYAEARSNLTAALARRGLALAESDRHPEAVDCYRQALQVAPDNAEAHNNLGVFLVRLGRAEEARRHYEQALWMRPHYAEALSNLGQLLAEEARWEEAANVLRRAVQLQPTAASRNNLGTVFWKQGRIEDAIACYQEALGLQPDHAETWSNLGAALSARGEGDEGLASFHKALALRPDHADTLNNLGGALKDQGRLDEAIACYRQAMALQPGNADFHSNLLLALHYHAGTEPAALFAEHRVWAERHAAPLAGEIRPLTVDRTVGRRLRIGYVSPDFREHVMGFYIEPVLAAHDRGRFEITCYANVARPDQRTERIRGLAEHWRPIAGVSDAAVAAMIRQDRIDILVDLAGHTGGHRLLVFARKPARVQVTHFAYMATTGLTTMDYRLTDGHVDPPGLTEPFHTEALERLPRIGWCYQAADSPGVNGLPAISRGFITFGSFNNLAKLTAETIAAWAGILRAVPSSRLAMLAGAGGAADRRLLDLFAGHGIGGDRLTLLGRRRRRDYLQLFHEVDVCLDPFPYTGCNTTCDALWMGVPLVTLAGRTGTARHSVAVLACLDLPEFIASTTDAYIEIAVRAARDISRLAELRAGLRRRMEVSPLMDHPGFTRRLEEAYQRMWDRQTQT